MWRLTILKANVSYPAKPLADTQSCVELFQVVLCLYPLMLCFLQLVDLKAELYRKQEQFKQEKLGQDSTGAGSKSKSNVKVQCVCVCVCVCVGGGGGGGVCVCVCVGEVCGMSDL